MGHSGNELTKFLALAYNGCADFRKVILLKLACNRILVILLLMS